MRIAKIITHLRFVQFVRNRIMGNTINVLNVLRLGNNMLELLMYWHFNLSIVFHHEVVSEVILGNVSCYTADVAQTDDTPDIMANGQKVFVGAIANNYYSFGTQVEILGRRYIVSDRMAKRYWKNDWDIYFQDYNECINFGRRKLIIKII